jgi:predicted glycogen debranching enzyme
MQDVRTDPDGALDVEWLVTNGLGGYAMGSRSGVPARSYHGLLVAALRPPVDRTMLVVGLEEAIAVDGRSGDPGPVWRVRMEGRRAAFTCEVDDVPIEKTIWMPDGANTTYVRYAVARPTDRSVTLRLVPLVTERDHHAPGRLDDVPGGPLRILAPGGRITPEERWVRDVHVAEETARGLADTQDLWAPLAIEAPIRADAPFTLILTAESADPVPPEVALTAAQDRDTELLRAAGVEVGAGGETSTLARLVLGADAFIVRRAIDGEPDGRTVIAGYPWFNDWGRDTMIALSGLALATGRTGESATILRSFARFVRDGLIPNDFPDDPARDPAYHTVDASLWFVHAVGEHVAATGDDAVLADLLPTLRSIVDRHIDGTRYGIGMDQDDGLLRCGADGFQLTWMDAKVDDWVVTPRRGKPVEIQALWINAVRRVGGWTADPALLALAARAETSFRGRFWRPDLGYLLDVVDGPDGDDPSLRPNQLLALSLPHPIVDATVARSVLAAVDRELHVPLGLRSLAPSDQAYRDRFQGDRYARDGAYHQGTVWTWLIGPYADAVAQFGGGPAAALDALKPFVRHLDEAGLGSVSEILEPEPPFTPRGCPFQAWGVAEVLRAWRAYGGR